MRYLLYAGLLVLLPLSVFAADTTILGGPIVPECTTLSGICQACDAAELIDNVLKFLVAFTTVIATLMFLYAGILYVTAAANPSNIDKAKKIFQSVGLGLVIVLVAWLIVDIIIRVFTGQNLNVLTRIECVAFSTVTGEYVWTGDVGGGITSGSGSGDTTTGGDQTASGLYRLPTQVCNSTETCQRLDPSIQCKEGACYCTQELCAKLGLLEQNYDGEWQITEDSIAGFAGHGRTCHQNGTCGDLNFTGRNKELGDKLAAGTATSAELDELAASIKKIQDAGDRSGLNLQYEVKTEEQRRELVRRGIPPDRVIAYPNQSAPHFSYLQCMPQNPRNSCPVVSGN